MEFVRKFQIILLLLLLLLLYIFCLQLHQRLKLKRTQNTSINHEVKAFAAVIYKNLIINAGSIDYMEIQENKFINQVDIQLRCLTKHSGFIQKDMIQLLTSAFKNHVKLGLLRFRSRVINIMPKVFVRNQENEVQIQPRRRQNKMKKHKARKQKNYQRRKHRKHRR